MSIFGEQCYPNPAACYAAAGFEAAVEADPEIDTVSVADLYRAETM